MFVLRWCCDVFMHWEEELPALGKSLIWGCFQWCPVEIAGYIPVLNVLRRNQWTYYLSSNRGKYLCNAIPSEYDCGAFSQIGWKNALLFTTMCECSNIYLSVTRSWSLSGNDGPKQSTVPTDWRVSCRRCISGENNVDFSWCTHWLRLMSGTVRCIFLCPIDGCCQILRYDIIRQGKRFYHRIAPLLYVLVFIEFQATCPAWPHWVGNTMVIRQSGKRNAHTLGVFYFTDGSWNGQIIALRIWQSDHSSWHGHAETGHPC